MSRDCVSDHYLLLSGSGLSYDPFSEAVYEEIDYSLMREKQGVTFLSGLCVCHALLKGKLLLSDPNLILCSSQICWEIKNSWI